MAGASDPVASLRYVELVESIGHALGETHGWKSEAARLLGVSPSFLTKLVKGKAKRVAHEIVARAAERTGIAPTYFSQADSGPWFAWLPRQPRADVARLAERAKEAEARAQNDAIAVAQRVHRCAVTAEPITAADARALSQAINEQLPFRSILADAEALGGAKEGDAALDPTINKAFRSRAVHAATDLLMFSSAFIGAGRAERHLAVGAAAQEAADIRARRK